jgi:hypothetical protein
MAIFSGDPSTQLAFSMSENKGVFAVLLGSGVSRSARVPTGWEVTLSLVQKAARAKGVTTEEDWEKWYVEQYGTNPNYSQLLEQLGSTPSERRNLIQAYIEPNEQELADGLKVPTPAHHAIAALVKAGYIRVIVTTNFDRLMEHALVERGVEPVVVSSLDSLKGADSLVHAPCYLFKVHGDYKDTRILNTDGELDAYPPEFDTLLDRIIDEFGLIVAGWSGDWDHALRRAFIRAPSRRYPTFWLARSGLSASGAELAKLRCASIIKASDADTFFVSLKDRVTTIESARSLNPETIELKIAMVKRFLSKPEYRIQLHDLVSAEIQKVLDQFSRVFAEDDNRWNRPFEDCVYEYESAIEPLVRITAVVGRWGDDRELELVQDAIVGLLRLARQCRAGSASLVALQDYPAALVLYGCGLGLIRSGRISALFQLLDTQTLVSRESLKSGIELCPSTLESDCWKIWTGLVKNQNSGTPLADRLIKNVFSGWAPEFAGVHSTESLYDSFEMYSHLYYIASNTTKSYMKAMIANQQFSQITFGRLRWGRDSHRHVLHELSQQAVREELLSAGFVGGDEEYLEIFIQGLGSLT